MDYNEKKNNQINSGPLVASSKSPKDAAVQFVAKRQACPQAKSYVDVVTSGPGLVNLTVPV